MPPKVASPLSSMQKISDRVFLFRPTAPHTARMGAPGLILVLGWMGASDVHLARYVNQYRALYPSSAIMLVKARLAGLALAPIGRNDAQPAVSPLYALLEDNDPASGRSPRLLIHVFSGGGSCTLHHLYDLYPRYFRDASAPMPGRSLPCVPQHITIFDSTPGEWSYQFATNVLTAGITTTWMRLLALPVVHAVAVAFWLGRHLFNAADSQKVWSAAHNDPRKVCETRRTYIYSDTDKVCAYRAVEAHADEAESRGFCVWKRELFHGSSHVAHMRTDPDRYWRVVQETWAAKIAHL